MSNYTEIQGDLIELAKEGKFDVISHGCNCFCVMGAGIAPQMAKAFGCDKYQYESTEFKGNIHKLGTINWGSSYVKPGEEIVYYTVNKSNQLLIDDGFKRVQVVNSYTQYNYTGSNNLDYEALALCMRKINHAFKGKHIGLPQIGAGLGGGDWNKIKEIIQRELKDCVITVVIYNKS
jgi:O-acetyl-ADP-ribose deacetylase (regulator of RNase III)